MPTARELLEQADALMRRNRAAAAAADAAKPAGTPVAPSVAPGAMPSPRTIQREPIAPSAARTSLPVDPSESPFILPGLGAPRRAALPDEAEVPVLTEAVADPAETDDVPVLTDAVDEIEVSEVLAETRPLVDESARGEISFWLDAQEGDGSLLGPAPDSVAVVPPPDVGGAVPVPPQSPTPGRDPLGFDQPAPAFRGTLSGDAVPASEGSPAEDAVSAGPGTLGPQESRPGIEDIDVRPMDSPVDFEAPAPKFEPATEAQAWAPAAAAAEASVATSAAIPAGEHEATPANAAGVPSADEARIREIAEEIGMQVLQRIDIFTDTSLRERLGERLKPVIERVSADLVDALNQHVGELLREYVAEAIEREIETWRERRGP